MKPITVFYAGLLYGEYDSLSNEERMSLPDGCYIYVTSKKMFWKDKLWYCKDITPRQPHDVPPELLVSVMLMS